MKGFYLTEQELIELRAAHREAKRRGASSSAYKINAIILLGTGWTFTKVKELPRDGWLTLTLLRVYHSLLYPQEKYNSCFLTFLVF